MALWLIAIPVVRVRGAAPWRRAAPAAHRAPRARGRPASDRRPTDGPTDRRSTLRATVCPSDSPEQLRCDGGEMLRNQIMYFTLVFTEKTPIQKNRKE